MATRARGWGKGRRRGEEKGSQGAVRRLYRGGADRLGVRAKGRPARRGAAGLNGVPLGHGRRTTPTGGALLSVAAGGEGRAGRAGEKEKVTGRRWDFGPREGKRKRREREMGWAGRAKICWAEKVFLFLFSKPNKQIQFKFKLKDLNSKWNHKQ